MHSTVAACTAAAFTTAPAIRLRLLSSSASSSSSSSTCAVRRVPRRCRRPALLCCCCSSEMEANAGTAVYPLHRCKTIYLVDCLRDHVTKCGLAKKIELVIASPLLRTMQTAVGVFGGEKTDGVSASQLMVEGAGHSGRQAISSLNCPPFLAVEACREHLGVHPCDKRRSITEYRTLFPAIDFSLIENDEDVLWKPDVREANESVAARGMKFFDWLWTREEKEIAIVSHSGFLYHTLNMYSKECHPSIRQEVGKHFANCELRSMVLVDRSMLGSDSSTCNFPGKIPAGLDLPSDVAGEKHLEEASKN